MKHKARMMQIMDRRAVVADYTDWDGKATYETAHDAEACYWRLVEWGYDAMCIPKTQKVTASLTDKMCNEDDMILGAVVAGIEKFIPDACADCGSQAECRDEAFHLAHDWLIDHKNYEPHENEEIALSAADHFFRV